MLLFSGLFRSVSGQKLQQVSRVILVEGLGELVNLGRNFKSLEENSFLSLKSNVSGPSDESGEVSLWLDSTANAESFWSVLEKAASDDVLLLAGSTGSPRLLTPTRPRTCSDFSRSTLLKSHKTRRPELSRLPRTRRTESRLRLPPQSC